MMQAIAPGSVRLGTRQIHGRAINAVAEYLRHALRVPEVYLEPKIARVTCPDILAVDRGGTGDLHAVDIQGVAEIRSRAQLRSMLPELKALPYHFKYLAIPHFAADLSSSLRFADYPELFDSSGIGRIGILSFEASVRDASSFDGSAAVQLIVRPERFRVQPEKLAAIEKFLEKAKPDMSVRL